jgi:hypothetical protein
VLQIDAFSRKQDVDIPFQPRTIVTLFIRNCYVCAFVERPSCLLFANNFPVYSFAKANNLRFTLANRANRDLLLGEKNCPCSSNAFIHH